MSDVMKLTDKQYRDAIDWVVMVQRGRFPIERGHIDAIAAILLPPKQQAAEEMFDALRRIALEPLTDDMEAGDATCLAEVVRIALAALVKAGQQ